MRRTKAAGAFALRPMAAPGSAVAFALTLTASQAQAGFHLIVIDEVMAGSGGDSTRQFVELKMQDSGQTFVAGAQGGQTREQGVAGRRLVTTAGPYMCHNRKTGAERSGVPR